MVKGISQIAGWAMLAFTSSSAFACSGSYTGTHPNGDTTGVMTVQSGKGCGYRFRSSMGPTYGVKVLQRPSHGTIHVTAQHGVYYRSRPGYVGTDSFSYARYGLDMWNKPRTTSAGIVTVNVIP